LVLTTVVKNLKPLLFFVPLGLVTLITSCAVQAQIRVWRAKPFASLWYQQFKPREMRMAGIRAKPTRGGGRVEPFRGQSGRRTFTSRMRMARVFSFDSVMWGTHSAFLTRRGDSIAATWAG
jgi:hypothetical protein